MRVFALFLAVTTATACATTGDPGTTTSVDRRTTSVSYGTGSGETSINLETANTIQKRTTPIAANAKTLWGVLPGAYQDLALDLAVYDSTLMVIGNPGLQVNRGRLGEVRVSRYLNCGTDPMGSALADRYNVRISVVSRVRETGAGASVLETEVSGDAAQRAVSSVAVSCASTGVLEEAVANAAKMRLAGVPPRG
ncbi:MAG TPA: hypothetical protein VF647_20860 [Longimicrobium sp.]|jgi:hypothetical protein